MCHDVHSVAAESGLLPHEGVLTVALSGGADSVALLLILRDLQPRYGYTLQAVHIHHGIRGSEADRDAAFCARLCAQQGIPLQCRYVNVPAFAAEKKLSPETAARILRYEALAEAAPEGLIATAHHADDQAETLLFHLVRGCGLRGLCGIPPKRGRIIRPLLQVAKQTLLAFLSERAQEYMTDSTNLTEDASRNFLRHRVMPLLVSQNPAALQHMTRTADMLSEDEDYLSEQAQAVWAKCLCSEWDGLGGLAQYHRVLRMRCYRMLLAPYDIDPAYRLLSAMDELVTGKEGKINVSDDVYVQVHRGMLYIMHDASPLCEALPLQMGENRLFVHRICRAELQTAPLSPKIHKTFTKSALDYDKIVGIPQFRQWQRHDRITLPGRAHSGTLRNYVQAAVPVPRRRTLYALYDDAGCIYCEGVGIAARVKPQAETQRLLVLQCTTDHMKCNR